MTESLGHLPLAVQPPNRQGYKGPLRSGESDGHQIGTAKRGKAFEFV